MRYPTKESSLASLKAKGLNVTTIFDVGVLAGTPELIRAFPDSKHMLFEPVAEFRPVIEQAYAIVAHELFTVAVSDTDGETDLAVTSVIEGLPISHSQMVDASRSPAMDRRAPAWQGQRREQAVRRVPMISLDTFMASQPHTGPYLLKIDIDGDELKVLNGAQKLLQHCAAVVIELHMTNLFERSAFLLTRNFRLYDIVDLCYYDERLSSVDGVFFNPAILGDLDVVTNFDLRKWQA